MKKRYILSSVIVALLILVSTQIGFLNIVRSDPSLHEGDAYVGDLWISELDVSGDLETVKFVGIAHTNSSQDFVKWTDGVGNITANYSVEIEDKHPEYWVTFALSVFNVDGDGCNEIGNDTFSKTYNADTLYDENGTLMVSVEFDRDFMESEEEATLLCYLGAKVRINNTEEAINFTSVAQDRSVLGVCFQHPADEPFSRFTDEANDEWPSMWSWIDGWDEGGKFDDEDHMLNTQTFFIVGSNSSPPSQSQVNDTWWDLGKIWVRITLLGRVKWNTQKFTVGNTTRDWSLSDEVAVGTSYLRYNISESGISPSVLMRYVLWCSEDFEIAGIGLHRWKDNDLHDSYFYSKVVAPNATNVDPADEYIDMNGFIWARSEIQIIPLVRVLLSDYGQYRIHINNSVNQSSSDGWSNYYWDGSCSYQNMTSSSLTVSSQNQSGIITSKPDISNALSLSNQCIYSFAADRNEVRVEFTC